MSERELAKSLIDQIPESRMYYVISYLQGAAVPDETPNATTIAALMEGDEMLKNGTGQHFQGSAEEFFALLDEEADDADD